MKVKVNEPPTEIGVTIATMLPGSLGITERGKIYLRTYDTTCCLNDFGASYSSGINSVREAVRLLPKGTVVQIEVEE